MVAEESFVYPPNIFIYKNKKARIITLINPARFAQGASDERAVQGENHTYHRYQVARHRVVGGHGKEDDHRVSQRQHNLEPV